MGRNLALATTFSDENSLPPDTAPQQPNWNENMERALEYLSDLSGIKEI
jgi:hypothetical protein